VVGFLTRALAFFEAHGIHVQRLMTDNGPAYWSVAHAAVCRQLRIRHLFAQPYRPKTNGKAERLTKTLLRKWAYAAAYSPAARTRALPGFLTRYNTIRPTRRWEESHPPNAVRTNQRACRRHLG
jgi:transposase InsO family protein